MEDIDLDHGALDKLGAALKDQFLMYRQDRKGAEEKWLRNLRAFSKIYDPEVVIPKGRSRAYPGLIRWKTIGTVSRLMQLLFPQSEKNYGLMASPVPDLTQAQLQEVLDTLVRLRAGAQGIAPGDVVLADDEIEQAIREFAMHKAENMEVKVDDDLRGMDYIALARQVVFSGTLYGLGLLEGPLHEKVKARMWVKDPNTGLYAAKDVDKYRPLFEFTRVWDYYPDMAGQSIRSLDGEFKRRIMTRAQVEELIERPDFLASRVKTWLDKNKSGNYAAEWWETAIKGEAKSDKNPVYTMGNTKYQAIVWWGDTLGRDLRAAGVSEIADSDLARAFKTEVWMLDSTVVKCKLAPFKGEVPRFHKFLFEEDDLNLLGNSLGNTLRDSQMSLCEVTRAMLDHSSVIGPNVAVNEDYLTPGQNLAVASNKTWRVEGLPAGVPLSSAVADVSFNSHLGDFLNLREVFLDFGDKESGLPPQSLGDVGGGGSEALRTQGNASMFLGAAALPIRDTVRNFDLFTQSVVGALVRWNQRFDPSPNREGDIDVLPRGSTSLIAKEVLAQSLDAVRMTLTEDEKPHVNVRKLLEMRLKARDVPTDALLETRERAEEIIQQNAEASGAQARGQQALVDAEVKERLSKVQANLAKAAKDGDASAVEALRLVSESLRAEEEAQVTKADAETRRMQSGKTRE